MADRITQLDIEGLRVIETLSLSLQPMNVLIGENGSGKSTVLEAIEILRKAATMSGEQFITELFSFHGGLQMFRHAPGAGSLRRMVLGLGWRGHGAGPYRYELTLEGDASRGSIRVVAEHLELGPLGGAAVPLKVIDRRNGNAQVFNQQAKRLERVDAADETVLLSALKSAPGEVLNAALPEARALIGATRVYPAFESNPAWARRIGEPQSAMRSGVIARPATSLERGGANLPNAYLAIRNSGSERWGGVLETLRLGLGHDLVDVAIDPDPSGGQLGLSIVFRSVGRVPAFALSDGQLGFLAFVAIAELEQDRDGLVGLDEPDAHQHPAMIGRTVSLCEQLSERRTVIVSTHSDRLLDALTAPARAVVLFERGPAGQTVARRPDPAWLKKWLADYNGLGSARAEGYESAIFTDEVVPPAVAS
ncbi:MAG: AAA family ATPase [Kofleriaceae bacterium]